MTTIYQTRHYKRIPKESHLLCTSLKGNPQVKGRYLKMLIITPRKPNSALRKVGRVQLVNGKKVFAKIAGSGLLPQKFANVLVIGHGYKDTPSVKYQILRGKYDCLTFLDKLKKRSRYAVENPFIIYKKREKKRKKKMFQYHSIISLIFITIFPFLLYWLSMLYSIYFSRSGKNIISREFYECGFKVINDNQTIIDIHYATIGLIFLIYEMEIIIFVPLFLNYFSYSISFIFIIIFSLFIIMFSYIYEWENFGFNLSL